MPTTDLRYVHATDPQNVPSFLNATFDGMPYRFVVLHATYEERRASRTESSREHAHDLYHIVLYVRGKGRFSLDGRAVPCEPGTLALTSPGQAHDFGSVGARAVAYRELTFALESDAGDALTAPLHELLSAYTGLPLRPIAVPAEVDDRQREWLDGAFRRALEALAKERDWLRAHVQIASMIEFLAREIYAPEGGRVGGAPRGVDRARELIELRYREGVTVEELAEEVHLASSYLIRAYKARFGQSPIQHMISLRVSAAASLLRTTSLSCKEIAAACGFGDIYQFSRTFKKRNGASPTEYRGKG